MNVQRPSATPPTNKQNKAKNKTITEIVEEKQIMSSQPASQPDSIDLAYDMWAGQFEFVGPTTNATTINQKHTLNNNNNTNSNSNNNNNNNNCVKFGNASQKLSSADSLEDLNLNFNTSSTQNPLCNAYSLGVTGQYPAFDKQPILIDQETFLSLNPADFEDIVPSDSEPSSLVFIENKLENNNNSLESNNNNNNNNNKIYNLETLTSKFNNKTNNTNTNGFKLENLKNFKNKLLCDFEENGGSGNGGSANGTNNKMNGALSAEICDNLNEQVSKLFQTSENPNVTHPPNDLQPLVEVHFGRFCHAFFIKSSGFTYCVVGSPAMFAC